MHYVPAHFRLETCGRALGDYCALIDYCDSITESISFLHDLSGQEYGHPVRTEPFEMLPDRKPALRIETGGWLIQKQQPWTVHQRSDEIDAAAHSARISAHSPVGNVSQTYEFKQLSRAGDRVAARHPVQHALQDEEVLPSGQIVESHLLHRESDTPPDCLSIAIDVITGNHSPARRLLQQRRQDFYGGRLSGAVGTQESEKLSSSHTEADSVNRAGSARIDLHQVFHANHEFVNHWHSFWPGEVCWSLC